MTWREYLDENEESVTVADGFDDAIIGVGRRCGQTAVVVYSRTKMVEVLCERDGMTQDEASEYLSFNVEGAWVGEGTPMVVDDEFVPTKAETTP